MTQQQIREAVNHFREINIRVKEAAQWVDAHYRQFCHYCRERMDEAGDHPAGCSCRRGNLPLKAALQKKLVMELEDIPEAPQEYQEFEQRYQSLVEASNTRTADTVYTLSAAISQYLEEDLFIKDVILRYSRLVKLWKTLPLPELDHLSRQEEPQSLDCMVTLCDEIINLIHDQYSLLREMEEILRKIDLWLDRTEQENMHQACATGAGLEPDWHEKVSAGNRPGRGIGNVIGGLVGGVFFGAAVVGNAVAGVVGSVLDKKHSGEPVSGSKEEEKEAAAPEPQTAEPILAEEARSDSVQFQGVAPHSIDPGEYFTVKIMMYREEDHLRAEREASLVADKVKKATSSVYRAEQGQEFRVALQSPDVELDITSEYMRWNGIFAAADFEVFLPEYYDRKQLRLRGRVYSGDAVVTDLKLILQVSVAGRQAVPCQKEDLRSAFVSYASADRAKVAARIQGILLARPEMELFFDVESLRRGEEWEPRLYKEISRRDLFYLFWSQKAAASEWVRKELDYALSQKTVEYIEPIPLESPEVCPPPECLMCKHFNDWTLRYTKNQ